MTDEAKSNKIRDLLNPAVTFFDEDQFQLAIKDLAAGDCNYQFENGETLLSVAAQHNNILVIDYLIDNGANTNAVIPASGQTILSYFIENNNIDMVAYLVKSGADVSKDIEKIKDLDLNLLLLTSIAQETRPDFIDLLLELGASPSTEVYLPSADDQPDTDMSNRIKVSAIGMAGTRNETATLEKLIEAGGDTEEAIDNIRLHQKLIQDQIEVLKDILSHVMENNPVDFSKYQEVFDQCEQSLGDEDFQFVVDYIINHVDELSRKISLLNDGIKNQQEENDELMNAVQRIRTQVDNGALYKESFLEKPVADTHAEFTAQSNGISLYAEEQVVSEQGTHHTQSAKTQLQKLKCDTNEAKTLSDICKQLKDDITTGKGRWTSGTHTDLKVKLLSALKDKLNSTMDMSNEDVAKIISMIQAIANLQRGINLVYKPASVYKLSELLVEKQLSAGEKVDLTKDLQRTILNPNIDLTVLLAQINQPISKVTSFRA